MPEDKESSEMAALGIALLLPTMVFQAFTLEMLWLWFIVPLGVREIGLTWSFGLILISDVLLIGRTKSNNGILAMCLHSMVALGVILTCGWLTHQIMK